MNTNKADQTSAPSEGQTAARPLADVLWEAANKRLWSGRGNNPDFMRDSHQSSESCCATVAAELGTWWSDRSLHWWDVKEKSKALKFLQKLGANTSEAGFYGFDKRERQGVRFMFLLLAMHVAEDEGVMV